MYKLVTLSTLLTLVPFIGYSADPPSFENLDARFTAATSVVKTAMDIPEKGIPKDLIRRCRGIAVFPSLFKIGLVVGVSFGDGVIVRRDEKSGEWSKPAFFRIQSGSVGLQLGAQFTDLVLLIMSERAVQRLLEDRFMLGADIGVAAGPVGREASAETNTSFDSGILSYSRTQGLFAGISLNGAIMEPDKAANTVYHGPGITVQDVFYEGKGALSDNARNFIKLLDSIVE